MLPNVYYVNKVDVNKVDRILLINYQIICCENEYLYVIKKNLYINIKYLILNKKFDNKSINKYNIFIMDEMIENNIIKIKFGLSLCTIENPDLRFQPLADHLYKLMCFS